MTCCYSHYPPCPPHQLCCVQAPDIYHTSWVYSSHAHLSKVYYLCVCQNCVFPHVRCCNPARIASVKIEMIQPSSYISVSIVKSCEIQIRRGKHEGNLRTKVLETGAFGMPLAGVVLKKFSGALSSVEVGCSSSLCTVDPKWVYVVVNISRYTRSHKISLYVYIK